MLTEEQYQAYKEDVFSITFTNQKPVSKPKAYIVAGQPGCGKSKVTKDLKARFYSVEGFVVVDPDNFRELHPKFVEYNHVDDRTSAVKTHPDASKISDEVREYAIKNKFNLIIDGTLKNKDNALNLVKELKANGYSVEVTALCVPPTDSYAGCTMRYATQKKEVGYGRYVPIEIHNQAVNALVISLIALIEQGFIDSLTLTNRDNNILFQYHSDRSTSITAKKRDIERLKQTFVTHGGRTEPFEKEYELTHAEMSPIMDIITRVGFRYSLRTSISALRKYGYPKIK